MTETVITSSVLILIVILLRTVFRGKINNRVRYGLWLIVAVRLIMPFSLAESSVSIMNFFGDLGDVYIPKAEGADAVGNDASLYESGVPYTVFADGTSGEAVPFAADKSRSETGNASENIEDTGINTATKITDGKKADGDSAKKIGSGISAGHVAKIIRLSVTAAMLIWFCVVNGVFYAGLRKKRKRVEYDAPLDVFVCGGLNSPCLFGIGKPSVYVTDEAARTKRSFELVALHELCHYYHGDMIWTVLRYVLLAVYWFNPLVWAAAALSKRDCEYACDEAVIRKIGGDRRFEYGKIIVDMIPEKRSGMLLVASTSMSSSGRALRSRIKFISGIPKNITAAVICTVIVIAAAAGCTFTSAEPRSDGDISSAVLTSGTALPKAARADIVSDLKGEEDIYIRVTDRSEEEKILFYMLPSGGGEAFAYMDKITEKPYETIGYIPEASEDVPAGTAECYYGERLSEFIESSRFSAVDISWENSSKQIKRSKNGSAFKAFTDAVSKLEPAFAGETDLGEVCGQASFFRENGGYSSRLKVCFYRRGERVLGQIFIEDYSGIVALITAEEQPPDAKALERAYYASVYAASDLFYAEDTEIFRLCAGHASAADVFGQTYESFGTDMFSEEFSELFEITGEMPQGYSEKSVGDIIVGLPNNGSASVIGGLLLWQNDGMTFRMGTGGEEDFSESPQSVGGTFCGKRCVYGKSGRVSRLSFEDSRGNIYTAIFDGEDSENTAAKIFGSIHIKSGPQTKIAR